MIEPASTDETDCARVDSNAYRIQKPRSLSQALREMKIKEDHDRKMKLREDYEKKCYEMKSYEMCMDWVDTKVYETRLSSFKQWPKGVPVHAADLSKAGFRYTGYGDSCVCCWCYLVVENWSEFDEPLRIHKRRNPDCEFIKMLLPSKKMERGNYKEYGNRLETFDGWDKEITIRKANLARAGLMYTGLGDRCQCVWCAAILHSWTWGDEAFSEHYRH